MTADSEGPDSASTSRESRGAVLDEESTAFGPLEIVFDTRVLRPRPWTQLQSRWAAEISASLPAGPALELCAGAGQIGLLFAHLTGRPLVAVDLNPVACEFATRNAAAAGLGDRVDVRHADMDDAIAPDERFPLVIADPPWVRSEDTATFPEDPLLAIDGGDDGLAIARRSLTVADRHLQLGGAVVIQVGDRGQLASLEGRRWRVVAYRQGERGVIGHLARA
ncbi:methyltransferase domain-containing protein [Nocardioides sp. R-C-SC26]|uniref:methyltransferase domain-containing protein n=1 Tax=Nocardioides sp. R-C-SC26 TaxID=2870414 RepID=UPI001E303E0A|nr:methyltransferase domain-containing protein [Nocardioides sp. R-C-SC26]